MSPRAILTPKKSSTQEAELAAFRLVCQTDVFALANRVLARDMGSENKLSRAFHGPLRDFMFTTPYRKNLYLLARGHLKTSLITVARNIQRILKNPQIRILIASNKAENAEAMLSEIKGHLVNPLLLRAFPDILWPEPERQAEAWTSSKITVRRKRRTKEATIETIGVTGEITSKHYDHSTFDDVVGKENSQTRDALLDTINFIRIAESLHDPGATQDFCGTPWHYADAWAWLQEEKASGRLELGVYKVPCWVPDPQGEHVPGFGKVRVSFPEKFSIESLMEIRRFKGPSDFAAQYLLDPVSSDTAYFPREKIVPNILLRRDMPPAGELWTVMTVDPAISTKAWADYSAIAVVGWDADGLMHILELKRGKWPESELVQQMYLSYQRFPQIQAVGFEAIGFQKIFRRLFNAEGERRGYFLPIISLERDTRITKNVRIRALEPLWAAGEIMIAADVPALEDFIDEASRWRPDRESAHDDLLDAVVDALQLRLRPDLAGQGAENWSDDPELLEKMQIEQSIIDERKQEKREPLDRTSLRAATMQARRIAALEAERLATVGAGNDFSEFSG